MDEYRSDQQPAPSLQRHSVERVPRPFSSCRAPVGGQSDNSGGAERIRPAHTSDTAVSLAKLTISCSRATAVFGKRMQPQWPAQSISCARTNDCLARAPSSTSSRLWPSHETKGDSVNLPTKKDDQNQERRHSAGTNTISGSGRRNVLAVNENCYILYVTTVTSLRRPYTFAGKALSTGQ